MPVHHASELPLGGGDLFERNAPLGQHFTQSRHGLFQRFPVESVYAMHNWPGMKPGCLGLTMGPMMASADRITIEITGKGGHGAHPYQTVDPVLVAAHIITAVQSIVSRNVRAIDSAVISLCSMQAGDPGAFSVIPGTARLIGTVRTVADAVQMDRLLARELQLDEAGQERLLAGTTLTPAALAASAKPVRINFSLPG